MRWPTTSKAFQVSPPSLRWVSVAGRPRNSASSAAGVRARSAMVSFTARTLYASGPITTRGRHPSSPGLSEHETRHEPEDDVRANAVASREGSAADAGYARSFDHFIPLVTP